MASDCEWELLRVRGCRTHYVDLHEVRAETGALFRV